MYIEFSLIFPDYTLFIYNLQTEQFSSIDVTMIWPYISIGDSSKMCFSKRFFVVVLLKEIIIIPNLKKERTKYIDISKEHCY